MKEKIYIFFVLMHIALVASTDKCDITKCPQIPKHYEEMDCVGVETEGDCCIRSFKCIDIKTRDVNKCYYKDEVYEVKENLKESQLAGTCNGNCICTEPHDGRMAEFVCAHIDCPEFLEPEYSESHDPTRKCIRQYDHDHCCAVKTLCDDELIPLSKCELENETYYEGQKMYPKDLCYSCLCSKEYNSTLAVHENPGCHKIDCKITLRNTVRLSQGCVPIYYKKENCCPIGWKCPNEMNLTVNKNFTRRSENGPTCKFGNLEFNIGDKLETEDENCQECMCSVPPMIHCIEKC